jgi:hypothetical protein
MNRTVLLLDDDGGGSKQSCELNNAPETMPRLLLRKAWSRAFLTTTRGKKKLCKNIDISK